MSQNDPINNDSFASGAAAREVDRARDAELVGNVRAGNPDAFGQLYDVWFDRVFNVALRILRNRDSAAEISQDAFLSAWKGLDGLTDPASFGGWVLRITRNAALNRAEREQRAMAVDQDGLAVIERSGQSPISAPQGFDVEGRVARHEDPAVAADDAEIIGLVHETAASLGPRDAEVLDLQLRFQLSPAEIGEILGLNRNAANQLCHRVRTRFAKAFGARLLWAGGRPTCPDLRAELTAQAATGFGADEVDTISRHAEECGACAEDRRTLISPAALFGGIALVPALVSTRTSVAHGLADAGVPMGGSSVISLPSQVGGGGSSTARPVEGPSSPAPAVAVASASGGAAQPAVRRGSSRRVVAALAAGAAIVVVAALFFVGRDDDSANRMIGRAGSTTLAATATATAGPAVPGSRAPGTAVERSMPRPTSGPIMVPPGSPTTTTASPTTTTPKPTVRQFLVAPDVPQPAVYATANAPVLSWSVVDATEVTIWRWYDDGVNGRQRMQIEATGLTGSKPLCPGSMPTPDACVAPSGRYHFELIATGADGTTLTSQLQPGFEVQRPVIS